jgi:7-cyano-7-deazaguanine synthase in queuosine biosynthesis
MAEKKKVVILYSGGLDSFIMKKLAEAKYPDLELILAHFNIGQAYSEKEDNAIRNSGFDVDYRKVEWLAKGEQLVAKSESNSGNIIIPGRNMILSSLAASIYSPDEVWMGGLKGEDHAGSTDKNQEFIDRSNNLWSYVYSPFEKTPQLVFPFIKENWGKFEAVEWVYKNGHATKEELLSTSSCLSDSEGKNCGHCVVCCRRKYIFKQLGFEEEYEQDPLTGEDNLKMIIRMLEVPLDAPDDHEKYHYDSWRRREIIPGLYIEFGTEDHAELIKIMEEKLKAL